VFYTIYKITNKINGKYYIGKHQTENLDDGYFGSGKLIKKAIKKYGIENFIKEILFVYDNEQEMNEKEKELVTLREDSYNLCPGGQGGFGYINKIISKDDRSKYGKIGGIKISTEIQTKGLFFKNLTNKFSKGNPYRFTKENNYMAGKQHSLEVKKKIGEANSLHQSGKKNSQYGTCWIYHPQLGNKKIDKEELNKYIELGYIKGRQKWY
jgi:hypothetical protein